MSIKTTHNVTRDFAMAAISQKLYSASDEQLADVLETLIHNGFYNFIIVSQEELEENKKREWPHPYLEDLWNLPEENNAH